MNARIVVGANLGDEGKGTVVAHNVKNCVGSTLVVLTNGGAQRAHSILTDVGSMTYQHFGSGTYYGADSYYSSKFILNPMQFAKEYKQHSRYNVIRTYRDEMCRWSTPFDMIANTIIEASRGSARHGSCGMGIWETVQRYHNMFNLTLDAFVNLQHDLQIKQLIRIKKYHEKRITIPDEWKDIWNSTDLLDNFISDCVFLANMSIPIKFDMIVKHYDNVIFENGQGLMLTDRGTDLPGTTPSNTGIADAVELLKNIKCDSLTIDYVTRPYLTRHGAGYVSKEQNRISLSQYIDHDRTNHYNEHQGSFRYGELDIIDLKERIFTDSYGLNATINLNVTHCDEMDREAEFKKLFDNVITYDSALIK